MEPVKLYGSRDGKKNDKIIKKDLRNRITRGLLLSVDRRTATQPTKKMRTIYGTRIDSILSIVDGIAVCVIGCEIVHIHNSNIIR